MKFPEWLTVYGDPSYRGDCPVEDLEHVTLVNAVRRACPKAASVMIHAQNEGKRTASKANWDKVRGMTAGTPDFVFSGCPSLVLELKRRDHTKSKWQDGQLAHLEAAKDHGAIVGVALGWEVAFDAVTEWQRGFDKA